MQNLVNSEKSLVDSALHPSGVGKMRNQKHTKYVNEYTHKYTYRYINAHIHLCVCVYVYLGPIYLEEVKYLKDKYNNSLVSVTNFKREGGKKR